MDDRRLFVIVDNLPAGTDSEQHEVHDPTHPANLLSADDLDYGGRWSSKGHSSSDSDETNLLRVQEEALCEEVEYYLELEKQNSENRDPLHRSFDEGTHIQPVKEEPPTHREHQVLKPPRSARKPLRRPHPETIARLNSQHQARNEHPTSEYINLSLPDNVLQINPDTGKGYWLGNQDSAPEPPSSEKHLANRDLYNSTGNSASDRWGSNTDSLYSRSDNNTSAYRESHARSDSNRSLDNLSYNSSDRAGSGYNSQCEGACANDNYYYNYREPDRSVKPYTPSQDNQRWSQPGGRRRQPQVPERHPQRRRSAPVTSHPSAPIQPSNAQPTPARRRGRRVQEDYLLAPSGRQGAYTYGDYRWAHQNTSPNSIHLRYQYISPTKRIEDRVEAVCKEVADIKKDLRDVRRPSAHRRNPRPNLERGHRW